MRSITKLWLPALAAGLAACGPNDADPGPGGVTIGDARALDEAAEAIERQAATASPEAAPVKPAGQARAH